MAAAAPLDPHAADLLRKNFSKEAADKLSPEELNVRARSR
jgi:hypothetical protein